MFEQITVQEAKDLISVASPMIIDVRDQESFDKKHVPNAQRFTVQELAAFCDTSAHTTPVLVYCYRGVSSQSVAQYLIEEGFRKVYNLVGGFEAWDAAK